MTRRLLVARVRKWRCSGWTVSSRRAAFRLRPGGVWSDDKCGRSALILWCRHGLCPAGGSHGLCDTGIDPLVNPGLDQLSLAAYSRWLAAAIGVGIVWGLGEILAHAGQPSN